MRGWPITVVALLLAGCVAEEAEPESSDAIVSDDPVVQDAIERADQATANASEDGPAPLPFLVDLDGDLLRDGAAELVLPAGSYGIVRLVFTADVWGEDEPWDGSASAMAGVAFRGGEGVGMSAFGFRPFGGDEPIRPYINFVNTPDDGWGGLSVRSSCSGDCAIPEHEYAFLVGSAGNATVLRIGMIDDWNDVQDDLFGREAVPIQADAVTRDAFAGLAYRVVYLAQTYEDATGIMEATYDGGPGAATYTGVERTTDFHAEADIVEAGIWAASMGGQDLVGAEQWSYTATAGDASHGAEDTWVHAPNSYLLAASGAFWPPLVQIQEIAAPGPMAFDAERVFTGQDDPTGLASYTYEGASVGHAGIDVVDLYGWDLGDVVPADGSAFCQVSTQVPVPVCHGDPALADQVVPSGR